MPQSPRERNLINLIALGSAVQPLTATLAILDKTQKAAGNGFKADGSVSQFSANSFMFALGLASTLTTAEMAKLMGHKLEELELAGISEAQFRQMLSQSLHKGTARFLMLGLLASLGCQS